MRLQGRGGGAGCEAAVCTTVGMWCGGGGGVKRAGAVGSLCRALDERRFTSPRISDFVSGKADEPKNWLCGG